MIQVMIYLIYLSELWSGRTSRVYDCGAWPSKVLSCVAVAWSRHRGGSIRASRALKEQTDRPWACELELVYIMLSLIHI